MAVSVEDRESVREEALVGQGEQGSAFGGGRDL